VNVTAQICVGAIPRRVHAGTPALAAHRDELEIATHASDTIVTSANLNGSPFTPLLVA